MRTRGINLHTKFFFSWLNTVSRVIGNLAINKHRNLHSRKTWLMKVHCELIVRGGKIAPNHNI